MPFQPPPSSSSPSNLPPPPKETPVTTPPGHYNRLLGKWALNDSSPFKHFDLDISLTARSLPPPPPRSSVSSSFNDEIETAPDPSYDPLTLPYLTINTSTTTQGSYDFREKLHFLFCYCGWRFHSFSSTETSASNYTYALSGNLNGHYRDGPSPYNDHVFALDCDYKAIQCVKDGTYNFITSSETTATITIEDGDYDQMRISFYQGRVSPKPFFFKRVETRNSIRYPEIEDQEEIVVDIPLDGHKGEAFKNLHIN
ncbi:hypothetical protein TrST_g13915 [Triparma strigata]|uniref:Uncharacterized protein n=1 Tax=Triparma strigata TaxID=1606541 RepID=A0A9W7BA35_9STRA|nr:hypothetical protein TrST_g13915 [Triparma strigata]